MQANEIEQLTNMYHHFWIDCSRSWCNCFAWLMTDTFSCNLCYYYSCLELIENEQKKNIKVNNLIQVK